MKLTNILTFIAILIFSACKNQSNVSEPTNDSDKKSEAAISKNKSLSLLDTTIVLSDTKDAHISGKSLSNKEAEILLYKYFKRKGVAARNDLNDTLLNSQDSLYVNFDTIYQIQTNKYSGAIISYWLGSADLNGHCFQPSKAVILNTEQGPKFTNEEFIPTNFTIDSTINSKVYGYDYDCGGRGIIRYLKVTLK